MLSMQDKKKIHRRHFDMFFLFSPENRFWLFMQIVSLELAWNGKACYLEKNKIKISLVCRLLN